MTEPRRRSSLFGEPVRRAATGTRPLSVSDVNALVRKRLEESFERLRVEGEISNLHLAPSGHAYFTLKDDRAQLSAVMWRDALQRTPFAIEDGGAVIASGRLTLYESRGQYQMSVERLEQAGLGELERRFRELRDRYVALGWFDQEHKVRLPFFPRVLALVTSPRGAAIRDLLTTIHRRHPRQRVIVVGVRVQGRGAAAEIAAAIDRVNARDDVDVMVVGRGGGSLEDLWAFNEPAVIEAIWHSRVPVVSAVGHEVDFTLADLVADVRAPTPTAAGELVVPDLLGLQQTLDEARCALERRARARIEDARRRLIAVSARRVLRDPELLLEAPRRRLSEARRRLDEGLRARAAIGRRRLADFELALARRAPKVAAQRARADVDRLGAALRAAMQRVLAERRGRAVVLERALRGLSPLAILERGYSITRAADGGILRDAGSAAPGSILVTELARGSLTSRVEAVEAGSHADASTEAKGRSRPAARPTPEA